MPSFKRLVIVAVIVGIALLLAGRAAVGGGAAEDFSTPTTGAISPAAATTIKFASPPPTRSSSSDVEPLSPAPDHDHDHGGEPSSSASSPPNAQLAAAAGAGGCGKWLQAMRSHFLSIHRFNRIKIAGVEPLAVSTVLPQLHASMCNGNVNGGGGGASNEGQQQQVVIDVGANDDEDITHWFNFFGVESGAPCGAKTRFFLVEPQRKYQAGLLQLATSRANGGKDTVVLHGAVGRDEQHGSTAAIFGTGQQGRVNLEGAKAAVSDASSKATKPVSEGETPILSLRRVLLEHNVPSTAPIVMLKVDCEGADATIITDSEPIFAAHRVGMLVFELNSRERFFKKRTADAARMLESHGYAMYAFGIEAASKDAVFVKANAAQIAKWRVKLETIVAFSPAMAARLGDVLQLRGPRALAKLPAIDANNACNEGAFTVPCPLCLKTTAAPVKVHL